VESEFEAERLPAATGRQRQTKLETLAGLDKPLISATFFLLK